MGPDKGRRRSIGLFSMGGSCLSSAVSYRNCLLFSTSKIKYFSSNCSVLLGLLSGFHFRDFGHLCASLFLSFYIPILVLN